MARSLRFDQGYQQEPYICDNSECENRRRKANRELNIAKYRIRELEKFNRETIDGIDSNDNIKSGSDINQQGSNEAEFYSREDSPHNKDFETII